MRLQTLEGAHAGAALHAPHAAPVPADGAEDARGVPLPVPAGAGAGRRRPGSPGLEVAERRGGEKGAQLVVGRRRRDARGQQRVGVLGVRGERGVGC